MLCLQYLVILAIPVLDIGKVLGTQICHPQNQKCNSSSCESTISCDHGVCTINGKCECDPCWTGESCQVYVDIYNPQFLINNDQIVISNPWTADPIFTAKAYDDDLGSTCSFEDSVCECAETSVSIISGNYNNLFFLNNVTGDLYVREAHKLSMGHAYTLVLAAHRRRILQSDATYLSTLELKIIVDDLHYMQNITQGNMLAVSAQKTLARHRRQVEDYAELSEFNATVISGDEDNMHIGLRLNYEMNMMIPTTDDEGMDITVEFFTKDIENPENEAVLCVFNAQMEDPPSGVTITDYEEEMLLSDQMNATAYDRIIIKFIVKNTNKESMLLKWKCSVTQVRNSATVFDSKYLFNIGVEYSKETYIWIAQFFITVKDFTDDKKMDWELNAPKEINLDSAGVFVIKAFVCIKSDDLIFEVIAEENDVVTVGNLGVKDFEVNYDSVPQNIYYYNTTLDGSYDNDIYSSAKLDLGVMTNVGDCKEAKEDANLITLTFAIYALNFESNIDKESKYTVNFYIGDTKFKTEDGIVKIIPRKDADKMVTSRNTSWILDTQKSAQGDMVIYQIWSNLTNDGYADIVLQVGVPRESGLPQLEACSARLWKYMGNFDVPFLNTTFIDPTIEDDKYVFKFNRIHVTDQRTPAIYEDSMIFVHLVIKVSSLEANTPDKELTPEVFYGTEGKADQQIDVGSITVQENEDAELPGLTVTNAVAWEDIYVGGAMVLNVTMTVPMGYGYSETYIEMSGAKAPLVLPAIRVCRAELSDVGRNLPCLRMHQDEVNEKFTTYSMSDNAVLTEPDMATLMLGDVGSLPVEGDNNATISYVFELPVGSVVTDDEIYSIYSGINVRTKMLTEFIANYSMKTGPPPDLEADKFPDVNCSFVNEGPVAPGQIKEVLIAVNTKIQSISSYSIEIEAATEDACIFGVKLIEFGRNLPCMDIETEPFFEPHDNVLHGNKIGGVKFPALSNIGFQDNSTDDTLIVKAMIRISSSFEEGKVDLKWRVVYGSLSKDGDLSIDVDKNADAAIVEGESDSRSFKSAYPGVAISLGSPVVVDFAFSLQNNSMASIMLSIQNAESSEKKAAYDICLSGVWFRGKNYPCFSPMPIPPTLSISDASSGHNDTATYNLGVVCNTFVATEEEENTVIMRIAMRSTDDGMLAVGDSFEIEGTTTIGSKPFMEPLKFTIADEAGQVETETPNLMPLSEEAIEIGIRERKWVTFKITIPVDAIVKVDVKARAPLQDDRAILTVHDLRFVSGGINIPCVMLYPNPEVQFKPVVKTTQSDVVMAHIGYFTNLGLTNKTNQAADGDDDIIVEVKVEMSDHPETNHESEFDLVLEAQVGQAALEAKQKMKVGRDGQEKPYLDVTVQVDNTQVYQCGDPISMVVTVEHNNSSRAEPVQAIVRIFLPPYIQFDESININATNIGKVTFDNESGGLDMVFPQFLFTDTAVVEVTLLADPNNKRGYGRGEVNATTPYRVLCTQTYRTEPSVNPKVEDAIFSCGPVGHVVYTVNSLECYQSLGLSDSTKIEDCQISASSAAKRETGPQKVRMGSDGGWSPALRLGMSNPYLQVDFLQTARVAGIDVEKVANTRFVTKYRIQYSQSGLGWQYANEITELQYNTENKATDKFANPIQARFIRMIVEEADSNDDETKYIGLRMEYFGCFIAEKSPTVSCAKEDPTWYSDDKKKYGRHFSVDTERDIMYFCDLEYNTANLACFSTNDGGSSWRVLPQTFGEVVGYDEESSMVYVVDKRNRAYMASEDGVTWIPIKNEDANATISKSSFSPSHRVPAFTTEDIASLNANAGKWKATFKGLVYEGKEEPRAYWSKCCNAN